MQPRRWTRLCLISLAAILVVSSILLVAQRRAARQVEMWSYIPLTGPADWHGDWELSSRGADPSQEGSLSGTDRVTIPFTGTRLALRVRRGSYRAHLWIRVDGEPANQLPHTERGAYLVLSSPDYEPQIATISVAEGLDDGRHVAEIVADRGWDQWPLVGWQVKRGPSTALYNQGLAALVAAAVTCLVGLIVSIPKQQSIQKDEGAREEWGGFPRFDSVLRIGDSPLASPASLVVAAGIFYLSPWLPLAVIAGVVLGGLILLRLDLGLALVAASAPFYLHPRPLLGKSFSMAEILILLCLASWTVQRIAGRRPILLRRASPSLADYAVLLIVLAAAASTLFANQRHVALRELRVVILEPALFYLMMRTSGLSEEATWRVVDGFVAGAAVVGVIGLIQYAAGINVITAEEGFRRLRSVYGSPNNAALYLGRAMPVLLAVAVFGRTVKRRIGYGILALPVGLALFLTFSRGSIVVGLPVALLAVGLLAGGRWRWIALAVVAAGLVALIPLLSTPRFAGLLDTRSGTLFFRLQLWRSSWKMFLDHPWLGVGPDNFLYQYRGRYILPSAWQEPHLSHAHNVLLTHATRLGVPGIAAAILLYAAFCRYSLSLRHSGKADTRALALGWMGAVAYSLAHGLVDASYYFVDLALAFLLALSLVQCLRRYRTNEQED